MKKKLLVFHPTIAPYRIDFFNDLNEAFDMRICLLYRNLISQKFDYETIERRFSFKPYYLKSFLKVGKRIYRRGYWKHLKEFDPDIVIVMAYNVDALLTYLYKIIFRKQYKIVAISDDSYNMVAEGNDFSKLHKLSRRLLAPRMDNIILVEPKSVNWHIDKYGKGIYFPIIKDPSKARNEYEHCLTISNEIAKKNKLTGHNVFVFVGRLVDIKNVNTIIEAFAQLEQKENVLVIVGDGPEREKLQEQADFLKANVIFTGRLEGDKLFAWYNVATCFILASYQESFGAVTNEALLAGCWSLVSNKAGSQCLVEDGKNGYTFNPMDVSELAHKMRLSIERLEVLTEIRLKENLMLVDYHERMKNLIYELER